MKVVISEGYKESARVVADLIIGTIKESSNPKLGLATGGSVEAVYAELVKSFEAGEVDFSKVTTVNLDEYIGIDPSCSMSYRTFMNSKLFDHINIPKENTYVACGPRNPNDEIKIFNEKLYGDKLLDLQLLGIGVDGHIGFNEPHTFLQAGVHIEDLDRSTIEANSRYFESPAEVPRQAITMGVGDILKAKRIVLIITGENKKEATKELLQNHEVKTSCPATLLKLHRDCIVVLDRDLAQIVGYDNCQPL